VLRAAASALMQVPSPPRRWDLACLLPDPSAAAFQRGWQTAGRQDHLECLRGSAGERRRALPRASVKSCWEGVLEVGAGLHDEPTGTPRLQAGSARVPT